MGRSLFLFLAFTCSLSVFSSSGKNNIITSYLRSDSTAMETEIFEKTEVMPSYPGGVQELVKFISNHLRYPKLARKNGLEGKVIIKFYVDVDGQVKEPVVLKDGVGGGAAEEAVRVISAMPRWKPGMKDAVPVRVYYTIPISFKLQ